MGAVNSCRCTKEGDTSELDLVKEQNFQTGPLSNNTKIVGKCENNLNLNDFSQPATKSRIEI